jgi:hypothetical protein
VHCILLGLLAFFVIFVVGVVHAGPVLVAGSLCRPPFLGLVFVACPVLVYPLCASSAASKKTSSNAYFIPSFHCFDDVVCVPEIVESEYLRC